MPGRLGRAAIFAFRATTAAATLGACGTAATPPSPPSTAIAQPYGAPPEPGPPPTTLAPPSSPPPDPTVVPPDTTAPPPSTTTAEHHHHHHDETTTRQIGDPGTLPADPELERVLTGPGMDPGSLTQGYGGPPSLPFHEELLRGGGSPPVE